MTTFAILASTSLLVFGDAAMAQNVQGPTNNDMSVEAAPVDDAMSTQTAPFEDATLPVENSGMTQVMPGSDATTPSDTDVMAQARAFTDDEISSFAATAIQIQSLQNGGGTNIQEKAEAIIASSGLDANTFNAIGIAIQNDPEVAERVQLAAGEI